MPVVVKLGRRSRSGRITTFRTLGPYLTAQIEEDSLVVFDGSAIRGLAHRVRGGKWETAEAPKERYHVVQIIVEGGEDALDFALEMTKGEER